MSPNGSFRDDERATSPVVAIVLMLGISVTLATTAGPFVFGQIDGMVPTNPRPSVSVWDDDTAWMTAQAGTNTTAFRIVYEGGDELSMEDTKVVVEDEDGDQVIAFEPDNGFAVSGSEDDVMGRLTINGDGSDDIVTEDDVFGFGDRLYINANSSTFSVGEEYTVRIVNAQTGATLVDITAKLG